MKQKTDFYETEDKRYKDCGKALLKNTPEHPNPNSSETICPLCGMSLINVSKNRLFVTNNKNNIRCLNPKCNYER